MSKAPKEKDFGKPEPQVNNVYEYRKAPELLPIDDEESRGGKNVKPMTITDEHHHSFFDAPEQPDLNFSKHLERKQGGRK